MSEATMRSPALVLVEAEPDTLLMLRRLMQVMIGSYDLIAVGSGAEALAAITQRPVPLLITDYNVLGMNGLELVQAVKVWTPTTIAVLITDIRTFGLEQFALSAGVDYYLPKPFQIEQLEAIVRAALTSGSTAP